MGEKGLREVVPECFECPERVLCLRTALSTKEGLELREEIVDRAAGTGMASRLQRWSQKKTLSRLLKEEKKRRK